MKRDDLLVTLSVAKNTQEILSTGLLLFQEIQALPHEAFPLEKSDPRFAETLLRTLKEVPMDLCNAEVIALFYKLEGMTIDLHSLYSEDKNDAFHVLGRVRRDRILELFREVPTRKCILDLGCADGTYFFHLKEFSKRVIGVDVSSERLERIRSRDADAELFEVDLNLQAVPLSDRSVSVILATEVLEHIHSVNHVFSEISRCLEPGGRLIVSIPNRRSLSRRLEAMRSGSHLHQSWFHPNDWDKSDLEKILGKHGLKIQYSYGVGFRLPKASFLLKYYSLQMVFSRISFVSQLCEDLLVVAVRN